MFADYSMLIFRYYEKLKAANKLPVDLIEPKPARLRDLCLIVCSERFDRKDETTLKNFFGNSGDREACLKAIEHYEIDRFKPLITYLGDPSVKTHTKNVELLAWLIDFQPRPFDYRMKYVVNETETPAIGASPNETQGLEAEPAVPAVNPDPRSTSPSEKEQVVQPGPPVQIGETPSQATFRRGRTMKTTKRVVALTTIIIVLVSIGFYELWRPSPKTYPPIPPGSQGCMFWAEDHYQPIPCNMKLGDTLVIALDSEKLVHFRKITRPDTISDNARGSVWYVRYRGNYEFYTSDGYHPIDPQLRLRPITPFIIAKHVPHD
jgi:hypothetical protein